MRHPGTAPAPGSGEGVDRPDGGRSTAGGRASALRVRGLSVTFSIRQGQVPAVAHVDLDVARGELVALLGESGSGKSVTARAIMGLDPGNARVHADEIRLGGVDLLALGEEQRRRLRGSRMSLIFQDALSALNPVLSIGDQIGELFREHEGVSRRQARRRAVEMLRQVGIPAPDKRVGDYPHQFSGGMRQRILIAMAIALKPELLIADEPTTALDVTVQAQILELLDTLRREMEMAVLLITHDLGVVSEVADRVAVMYAGRIVETGAADDLFAHPAHPYTEALLRSVPRVEHLSGDLHAIPGSPPNPLQLPAGCPFHPRCEWVVERCRAERPQLMALPAGRSAACHRAEEVLHASYR
jgi:oligopeptide transport system ATP-binding protein